MTNFQFFIFCTFLIDDGLQFGVEQLLLLHAVDLSIDSLLVLQSHFR